MISDTSELERKSSVSGPLAKLCRMLRSMLRRYPQARLWVYQGGFGVSLDAQTYMRVSYSGNWTAEDMRDLHALFATWLIADPARLTTHGERLAGVLQKAIQESGLSVTREDSSGAS